jgi:hypothetical protein
MVQVEILAPQKSDLRVNNLEVKAIRAILTHIHINISAVVSVAEVGYKFEALTIGRRTEVARPTYCGSEKSSTL